MNIKVIALVILLSPLANASTFYDVGTSKTGCAGARRDAQVIAKTHCNSLDTELKMRRIGKCKKGKIRGGRRQYRVSFSYKCLISTPKFGYY